MASILASQLHFPSTFSPPPNPRRTGTTTFAIFPRDKSQLPSVPFKPQRPGSTKAPFQFKSQTPVLFAAPSSRVLSTPSSGVSEPQPELSRHATLDATTPTKGKGKKGEAVALTPTTPARPGLGYFAFPEGSPPPVLSSGITQCTPPRIEGVEPCPSSPSSQIQHPTPAGCSSSAHHQTPRPPHPPSDNTQPGSRKLEQAEAERGEEEWVARGGLLRDRFGNVDEVRTKKIREEIERRQREKELKKRWEAYEEGWTLLIGRCKNRTRRVPSGTTRKRNDKGKEKAKEDQEEERNDDDIVLKDIGFSDIPWPLWIEGETAQTPLLSLSMSISLVSSANRSPTPLPENPSTLRRPITLQDLTIDRIEDFLLSPLNIRGCTETPKARVRRSFLRWHPDKLGWLVEKVKDEDVEDMKTGVGVVLECLKGLNGRLRNGLGDSPGSGTPLSSESG